MGGRPPQWVAGHPQKALGWPRHPRGPRCGPLGVVQPPSMRIGVGKKKKIQKIEWVAGHQLHALGVAAPPPKDLDLGVADKNWGGLATLDSHQRVALATLDGPRGGMATPGRPCRWTAEALWGWRGHPRAFCGWSATHWGGQPIICFFFFSFNLFKKKKSLRGKKWFFFFLKKKNLVIALIFLEE
jgi:hypothetical protein